MGELITMPLPWLKCLEFFYLLTPGAQRITKPKTRLPRSYINEITQPCFRGIVCHQIYIWRTQCPTWLDATIYLGAFPLWRHDHKRINKSHSVINNRCRIKSVDKFHQVSGPYAFSTTSKSHCSKKLPKQLFSLKSCLLWKLSLLFYALTGETDTDSLEPAFLKERNFFLKERNTFKNKFMKWNQWFD